MSVLKQFEYLKIQLEAIESATNNFAENRCIGRGGFGKVYKGELLHSRGRTIVALKRLDRTFGQGDSEFWKEVIMLSIYRHQNIVSLLGFCDEKGEKILVYEYASRRSLDLNLDNEDLKWVRRLRICIGAARGLAYLHDPGESQQRVLHRDIKSSNILLDENWNARISDLGLSRFGPANQRYTFLVTNNTVGTIGYCDPLYLETGILTKESDVYSFGVVLFEVLCGRLCFLNTEKSFTQLIRKHYKQNLHEVIWCKIRDEIHPSSLKVFSTIAYQCLKRDNEKRPLISEVVTELETALKYQLSTDSVHTHEDKAQPAFKTIKQEKVDFREPVGRFVTRGVDEESSIQNPPKDLKRHICFSLVKKVPLFKDMDESLLEDICKRLKPCLYTNETCIIQEGDPVDQMLFIVRGRVEITTKYGWISGFLEEGDYCCEELLTLALDPKSGANIPYSTRTLRSLGDVKAFALPASEIKFIISQFSRPPPRQVRYSSQQWRTWGAYYIQAAWRRYSMRKKKARNKSLRTTILALRFAGKLLRGVHRNRDLKSDNIIISQSSRPPPRQVRYSSQQWQTWGASYIQAAWRKYSKRKKKARNKSLRTTILALRFAAKLLRAVYRNRDLKSDSIIISQFSRPPPRQVRYSSQQWQTWGASYIQAAWRRYSKRKKKARNKSLRTTILALRFAAKLLRGVHRNRDLKSDSIIISQYSRPPPRQVRYSSQQWRTWGAYHIQAAWRRYSKRKKKVRNKSLRTTNWP